jgi:hypothetical protein
MLARIEHNQRRAVEQMLDGRIKRVPAGLGPDARRLEDRSGNQVPGIEQAQIDDQNLVNDRAPCLGDLQRKARLADAATAEQGDQAALTQEILQLGQLRTAADEPAQRRRTNHLTHRHPPSPAAAWRAGWCHRPVRW